MYYDAHSFTSFSSFSLRRPLPPPTMLGFEDLLVDLQEIEDWVVSEPGLLGGDSLTQGGGVGFPVAPRRPLWWCCGTVLVGNAGRELEVPPPRFGLPPPRPTIFLSVGTVLVAAEAILCTELADFSDEWDLNTLYTKEML